MELTIHRVVTGPWHENCYVAHADATQAIIIDPGADLEKIEACVGEAGLGVKAVLLTHGHFDHIGAVAALRKRYDVPCLLHQADHKLVRRANLYRMIFDSKDPIEVPLVEALPEPKAAPLTLAGLRIETIPAPGHTPGGVCLRIGDDLFSGDTILRGRAGRVDLPGGNAKQLAASLKRLRALPAETRVHPGHGDATTIGTELEGALALKKVTL